MVANWIGHILRRNCLLKQVIEGKIKGEMEVARRRRRRRKKLLDDLKDRRGYSHLKEEALDSIIWRHRFGGGFGPVVRQNTEWMNERSRVGQDLSGTFRLYSVVERDDILSSLLFSVIWTYAICKAKKKGGGVWKLIGTHQFLVCAGDVKLLDENKCHRGKHRTSISR